MQGGVEEPDLGFVLCFRGVHCVPMSKWDVTYQLVGMLSSRDCGPFMPSPRTTTRSEEHTSELQSLAYLVCRLLLEKKKKTTNYSDTSGAEPITRTTRSNDRPSAIGHLTRGYVPWRN